MSHLGVFRTFRFALDAKLGIVTSPEQQAGKPGAFVSNTTYIPDVDIPAGVDLPFNKAALEKQASYGRPWLAGGPKLAAGVGGTFVEPANFVAPKAPAKKKK